MPSVATPAPFRADVRVHEPIVLGRVDADTSLPGKLANLAFESPRIDTAFGIRRDDSKINGVPQRVLAVGRDVVAFLSHHLVELRAAKAAHQFDTRTGVVRGQRAKEIEQRWGHRDARSRHSIGE